MTWTDILQGATETAPVGAEVAPYPYISGFGLLTRMTRLGALTGPEITQLGFRNRSVIDVALTTQQLQAPARTVLDAAGLASTRIAEFWPLERWSPTRLGRLLDSPRPVQHCPDCAAHGYHSTLFQLPSVHRCPWHSTPLINSCPHCSQLLWSRFNRLGKLGICECGCDLFNPSVASIDMWEFPTQAADAWSSEYLAWAATERQHRWVAANPAAPTLTAGIAALAPPPENLQPASAVPGTLVETFADEGEEPSPGAFWGWLHLGGLRDFTYAPLPRELHPKLLAATRQAVETLPASTSTPLELVTKRGFERSLTLNENVASRPRCFIAPHCLSSEGPTWLNLSAVDPSAIEGCRKALEGAVNGLELAVPVMDRSPQTLTSQALDTVAGRRHLADALAAIILQGYRQGLELILRTLAGQRAPTGKTHWITPVVEFHRREGGLVQVRICWVSGEPPSPKRAVEGLESPSASSQKRRPSATRRKTQGPSRREGHESGADSLRNR